MDFDHLWPRPVIDYVTAFNAQRGLCSCGAALISTMTADLTSKADCHPRGNDLICCDCAPPGDTCHLCEGADGVVVPLPGTAPRRPVTD